MNKRITLRHEFTLQEKIELINRLEAKRETTLKDFQKQI
jgi:hypothetical protein